MSEPGTVAAAQRPRGEWGLLLLGVALVLGCCADGLLRVVPWGLNFFVWVTLLVGSIWALRTHARPTAPPPPGADQGGKDSPVLLCLIPVYAAGWVWRDSATLRFLSLAAILVLFAWICWRRQGGVLRLGTLTGYFFAAVILGIQLLFGILVLLFRHVSWRRSQEGKWGSHAGSVALGLALALPVVIVFGALFSAADAAFEKLVVETFNFETLVLHGIGIVFGTWVAAGLLKGTLLGEPPELPPVPRSWRPQLGPIEISIVLTALNLLFVAFIAVQFRYFFGGETQLEITPGLLRSEYARRGFFELVAVASLVMPLLLLSDWLLPAGSKSSFRVLAAALIVMVFIVLASAAQRMWLYQREFGLTELRFYTSAFMFWLALILLWLGATVLRGRRELFAFGAAVSALISIAILHAANPDALIADVNLQRAQAGSKLDTRYLVSLSADAFPVLARAWPRLSEKEQKIAIARMTPSSSDDVGWRTWSLARSRAQRAVAGLLSVTNHP